MLLFTRIYPGVLESLQSLKVRGYTIGIVTTKYHYRIEQILERYNATKLIDLIVGAEDVKIEKQIQKDYFGLLIDLV